MIMLEIDTSPSPQTDYEAPFRKGSFDDAADLSTRRHLELERLAAQATARLNDALYAINQVIKAPEPHPPTRHNLSSPFHPRTGKVRRPREQDSSDDETFGAPESSDDESNTCGPIFEGMMPSSRTLTSCKRGRPLSTKPNPCDVPWVSTTNGRFGTNKPKCPPCARLKKKDPCNGQAPCRQCYGKGRRTPEECQEWGENYVPKIRKKRAARGSLKKV
jgi:hypothetical protein